MEVEREREQEIEWLEAQKIVISVDLLAAAKQQLQFLAAVDKNRCLYDGPALEKAIYRYNAFWLPLLAKHTESPISEGPLAVPLDCEWVWHCHRLNPVRYKSDCEELYGRILDNSNVVSSVKGICKRQTEEIWKRLYPNEPFEFDLSRTFSGATNEKISAVEKCTNYDLFSAVKRQSPFFYQVSRPHMDNDIFLEEAVARYKGFLHLIKRSKEKFIKCFSVPTYDIDLIWHTHQLHPISYCKDVSQVLGKILEHDDMDSDRTKGKKLDVGFSGTTKRWEETFGSRYWKAGAMYRGSAPSPLTNTPFCPNILSKGTVESNECQKIIQLSEIDIVDVLLEIVGVKNLPEGHKGSFYVTFSKKQPDVFFNVKRKLTILSESGEKNVASFQCEPKGQLFFELVSQSPSNLPLTKAFKTMGTASLSLQDFLNPVSKLIVEKWVELLPSSGNRGSKPICLKIAASFTVPIQASRVVRMVHSCPLSKNSCFLPLPGMVQQANGRTRVIDETHAEIISLQMRDSTKAKVKDKSIPKKQVIGAVKSGEICTLAEFEGTQWSLMDSKWYLQFKKKSNEDGHLLELAGHRMVKIFQGRKLEFEPKHCEKRRNEQDFMTAVEFSSEDPYGKALALLDLKTGFVKVKEAWFILPAIISAFILSNILKKEGFDGFTMERENLKEADGVVEKLDGFLVEPKQTSLTTFEESKVELYMDVAQGNMAVSGGCGGSCGGGCGSGCGNMVKSCGRGGGSGSGCGCGACGSGACGSMVKSGGCGSGCGSCGGRWPANTMKTGGFGGCGAGCGGCGAGFVDKTTYEQSVVESCTDPIHMKVTVVA